MATFKEVVEQYTNEGTKCKCDNCGHTFEEPLLVNPSNNVSIPAPPSPFVFVSKDEVVMGGKMPDSSIGDKWMACPKCSYVHLFGFDVVKQ